MCVFTFWSPVLRFFIPSCRPAIQVLYVIELRQDLDNGKAMFTAVSQFLMTHPVLSFGVREVTYSRLQNTEVLPAEEESESLSTGLRASSWNSRLFAAF